MQPGYAGSNGVVGNRWFTVTYSSASWRSLNLLKGSLNHPKMGTSRIARYTYIAPFIYMYPLNYMYKKWNLQPGILWVVPPFQDSSGILSGLLRDPHLVTIASWVLGDNPEVLASPTIGGITRETDRGRVEDFLQIRSCCFFEFINQQIGVGELSMGMLKYWKLYLYYICQTHIYIYIHIYLYIYNIYTYIWYVFIYTYKWVNFDCDLRWMVDGDILK